MKENKIMKFIVIFTILLILIDQITKFVIKYNYQEPIGNDFFSITLVQNDGMAFGLNSGNTKNIVITILILCIIINFIKNQKDRIDKKTAVSISLILAGGMSNLMDRIFSRWSDRFYQNKKFCYF